MTATNRISVSDVILRELAPQTAESRQPSLSASRGFNGTEPQALLNLIQRVEEAVDILNRHTGEPKQSAVTVQDLDTILTLLIEFIQGQGATGSFTAQSGETVTVTNGIITSIV